ncbi:MAG TPA: FAD-binding oxidoreductase [Solirubrobacteraceae bacterium]|nr:FAD-binding oxidoreductase [Solirubrobacteraceae bacterium]
MPEERADLVVIGAGTIGGWAAVFAAEQGAARVLVLDAGTAGTGASSRAAGIVRTQGGTPTAVDLARWTTAFYRGQHERYGIDSGFRTLGYLVLAFDAADEAAARERLAMQRERGLDSRWVSAEDAAALLPVLDPARITGATYCAEDGAIDPPRNVLAYTVALKAAGVDLRERTPATGLRIEGGRVTGVQTAGGTIATERVILAGGVGQGALTALTGGPAAPVGGARHQIAVTSPHPALGGNPLPMAFELSTGLYWRQEEGGILFGMSNPVEKPGEAREIDWGHLRAIRARLAELVPVTAGLDLRRVWTATIDYTPDHLPILGSALGPGREPLAGVTVASPGGHGMMWGPAIARIAADLALHGSTGVTDALILGPERFDERGNSALATDPIALPFPETVG